MVHANQFCLVYRYLNELFRSNYYHITQEEIVVDYQSIMSTRDNTQAVCSQNKSNLTTASHSICYLRQQFFQSLSLHARRMIGLFYRTTDSTSPIRTIVICYNNQRPNVTKRRVYNSSSTHYSTE